MTLCIAFFMWKITVSQEDFCFHKNYQNQGKNLKNYANYQPIMVRWSEACINKHKNGKNIDLVEVGLSDEFSVLAKNIWHLCNLVADIVKNAVHCSVTNIGSKWFDLFIAIAHFTRNKNHISLQYLDGISMATLYNTNVLTTYTKWLPGEKKQKFKTKHTQIWT